MCPPPHSFILNSNPMNPINFIIASGEPNNELSLITKTPGGYLYAIHIDQLSERFQDLFEVAHSELISFLPGDRPMIEITRKGAILVSRKFKSQKLHYPLMLVKEQIRGRYFWTFHTKEELESGKIKFIN